MESAEASGKTVEDALNRALATLGVSRDEVEFTVLDEGQKGGLFGRGSRDAVVRVELLSEPLAPAANRDLPDTRIPRSATAGGTAAGGGQRGGGAPAGQQRGRRPQARGGERPPRGGQRQTRTGYEAPAPRLTEEDFLRTPRYDAPTGEAAPAPERASSAPRGRRGPASERPREERRSDGGDRERRRRDEQPPVEPDINAEEVDFAAQVVDDLLRLLDVDADITIREPLTAGDGRGAVRAVIDIKGDDLGLLIGRRGDTLIALQYLVNLIVTRRYPNKGGVSIDVEHYKHRREDQLVSLAQRMADRVRQTGSPITLEPMTAAERRLIHMALADDPELETNSVGEGENRKVVISARQ